jgi:hypothetical protein
MNKEKLIRDLVLGDGSIFSPQTKNSGCCLGIGHCDKQFAWIQRKHEWLEEAGIKHRFYQDSFSNRLGERAWRIRGTLTQEMRRLRESWYTYNDKDYFSMLNYCKVDDETLAILFLDNGSRAIKKDYKDYNTGRRWQIEPYIEKFRLSVGKRNQDPIVLMLKSFGVDSRKSREFTGNGEVCIGTNEGKQILKYILMEFCEKYKLASVFQYKYDFPTSMSQVKRLSEMAPIR